MGLSEVLERCVALSYVFPRFGGVCTGTEYITALNASASA